MKDNPYISPASATAHGTPLGAIVIAYPLLLSAVFFGTVLLQAISPDVAARVRHLPSLLMATAFFAYALHLGRLSASPARRILPVIAFLYIVVLLFSLTIAYYETFNRMIDWLIDFTTAFFYLTTRLKKHQYRLFFAALLLGLLPMSAIAHQLGRIYNLQLVVAISGIVPGLLFPAYTVALLRVFKGLAREDFSPP